MADCCSITMLGYLAIIFILYKVHKILHIILYPYVVQKRLLGHFINFPGYGKWAVVTGSTDGIGKGYAKELAKRGMNVYLISRNQTKLDNTAKEIKELSRKNIEVRTLALDFGTATLESYQVIKDALKNLEVGVLINNVGVSTEYPDNFVDYPGNDKMTYIVLPQMLQRHKGIIVNVSSALGFRPTPFYSIYSATKSYLSFFTKGLIEEYKDSGIIFQCMHPYGVATNMSKIKKANIFAPDADYFASSALDTIGIESESVGCISHACQHALLEIMPNCLYLWGMKKVCEKTKEKYMAKIGKNK